MDLNARAANLTKFSSTAYSSLQEKYSRWLPKFNPSDAGHFHYHKMRGSFDVLYNEKQFGIGEWLNRSAAAINSLSPKAQLEAIRGMSKDVRTMFGRAPELIGGKPYASASFYARSNMILDINAVSKSRQINTAPYGTYSLLDKQKMDYAWSASHIAKGRLFGGLSDKDIKNYFVAGKDIANISPYFGSWSQVRKLTTIRNFMSLRGGQGIMSEPLMKAEAIRNLHGKRGISTHLLRGVKDKGMRDTIFSAVNRPAVMGWGTLVGGGNKTGLYENLIGGGAITKRGSFSNIRAYGLADLQFSQQKLTSMFGDKAAPLIDKLKSAGRKLTPRELVMLKAASPNEPKDLVALIKSGKRPVNAYRDVLGKSLPDYALVGASTFEGDTGKLSYLQTSKHAFEGGKANIGERKMTTESHSTSLFEQELGEWLTAQGEQDVSYVAKKANVMLPILGKAGSEAERNIVPYFEGALLYLTRPEAGLVGKDIKANMHAVAKMLSDKVSVSSIGGDPVLAAPNGFGITTEMTKTLINAVHQLDPRAGRLLVNGRLMPMMMRGLHQNRLAKVGRVARIGMHDVAGLMMQGHDFWAARFASTIAAGGKEFANEINSVASFFHSATAESIPGALSIPSGEVTRDTMDLLRIQGGKIPQGVVENNIAQLFDVKQAEKAGTYSGKPFMLDLPFDIEVETEKGITKKMNKVPLVSLGARAVTVSPGEDVWSSDLSRSISDVLFASAGGSTIPNQADVQASVQKYYNLLGERMLGKEGAYTKRALKYNARGVAGTLGFLNKEAERNIVATQFGGHGSAEGIVAMSEGQFRKALNINKATVAKEEIQKMIEGGVYLPVIRHPSAPRGVTFGRVAITDWVPKDIMTDYGPDQLLSSSGIGTYLHGDKDGDRIIAMFEYLKLNREKMNKERTLELDSTSAFYNRRAKESHEEMVGTFDYFRQHEIGKMADVKENTFDEIASRIGGLETYSAAEAQTNLVKAQFQKGNLTGSAYNAFLNIYEGGKKEHGRMRSLKLATMMAEVHEAGGLDVKRSAAGSLNFLDDNFNDILFGNHSSASEAAERSNRMMAFMMQSETFKQGTEAQRNKDIADTLGILDIQKTRGLPLKTQQQISGRGKSNLTDIAKLLDPVPGTVVPGGIMDTLGTARSSYVSQIAGSNEKLIKAAKNPQEANGVLERGWGKMKKAVKGFTEDLKIGKGWGKAAIGIGVLAGIGLSLRRPQRITSMDTLQPNESESPVVMPRNQRSLSVMTSDQYNVRIRVKDAQKVNRKKFVHISNAISGNFKDHSTKSNIHIRDDSRDVDYNRVFSDAYDNQME